MICSQNENMKQFNTFTQQIGRKRAAYYRGLTHKGMGGVHERPVPGHPTAIKPNITQSLSSGCTVVSIKVSKGEISRILMCW